MILTRLLSTLCASALLLAVGLTLQPGKTHARAQMENAGDNEEHGSSQPDDSNTDCNLNVPCNTPSGNVPRGSNVPREEDVPREERDDSRERDAAPRLELSSDAREAAVGAQPWAPDTARVELKEEQPAFNSADGRLAVLRTAGAPLYVVYDPVGCGPGPEAPVPRGVACDAVPEGPVPRGFAFDPGPDLPVPRGLLLLASANVQLQVQGESSQAVLALRYSEAELAAVGGDPTVLRMHYYDPTTHTWIELPRQIDPDSRSVTVLDVDISALSDRLTRVALMAPNSHAEPGVGEEDGAEGPVPQ